MQQAGEEILFSISNNPKAIQEGFRTGVRVRNFWIKTNNQMTAEA
jgi:hypothetical protein